MFCRRATAILVITLVRPALAQELTLRVGLIGTERPTSFKPQLRVQITNESFTSFPLVDQVKTSELLFDGRPFKRTDVPFNGPVGLAPKGSWEGCLNLDEYVPQAIPPGSHDLEWHLGGAFSPKIHARFPKTVTAAATPQDQLRQVEALKGVLVPGLLRSCVENWLTERDGGLASSDAVRYYVDPGVKVLVPYDGSVPEPRVKGAARIYLESRVAD